MASVLRGLVAVVAGVLLGSVLITGCGSLTAPGSAPSKPATGVSGGKPSVHPESGLSYIDLDQLPPEARQTIKLIDAGGQFPFDEDGSVFSNREGILPDEPHGFYREYTVLTPGESDRGARRIIGGDHDRILYYTDDHYQSFARIRR